jgi:hypothetical protein
LRSPPANDRSTKCWESLGLVSLPLLPKKGFPLQRTKLVDVHLETLRCLPCGPDHPRGASRVPAFGVKVHQNPTNAPGRKRGGAILQLGSVVFHCCDYPCRHPLDHVWLAWQPLQTAALNEATVFCYQLLPLYPLVWVCLEREQVRKFIGVERIESGDRLFLSLRSNLVVSD